LTARFVASKQAVPARGRKDWPDAVVPGLSLRVSANGHRSYVLVARYPLHPRNPTRRALGDAGTLTLDEARERARRWLLLIGKGIDPKIDEERSRAAEKRAQAASFEAVWHAFWEQHASKLAKSQEAARAGVAFTRLFGLRPASEIEPAEISAYIRDIAKTAPEEARNRLGHLRRMYSWAIGSGGFRLSVNPCSVLKPVDLIGRKQSRDRVLSDDEVRAVWAACDGPAGIEALIKARARKEPRGPDALLGFPFGPLVRLMLLTGQRERECAGMVWGEIDFDSALWVIPKERMKLDRAHAVPLAPEALALLQSLPRFTGPHVFSTTGGKKPVNGFSKTKERLDRLSCVQDWILHDLRRTMRSHLSALPIEDRVREQMIAHAQPGLHKVYDLYSYLPEKRRGFELWEQRLRNILAPMLPADVADIREARPQRVA
jgi:integrase